MGKFGYMDALEASLRIAIEKGIIREWSIRREHIIIHRRSSNVWLPITDAIEYVDDLLQQHKAAGSMSRA